jgi:CDP-2,3-bis-(O-geranylgeranyl)-sn-glycerol synthase
LGLKVHAQAIGLDQIPEALLPLLILQLRLELSAAEILWLVAAFALFEAVLSYVLYKFVYASSPTNPFCC